MNETEYPKFPVPVTTMKKMFEKDNFFHGCNKEQILSKGSAYHICKSDNGKLLLLVQILDNEQTILASLPWEEKPYDAMTNPWLTIKTTTTARTCEGVAVKVSTKKNFHKFGMNQGWTIDKKNIRKFGMNQGLATAVALMI